MANPNEVVGGPIATNTPKNPPVTLGQFYEYPTALMAGKLTRIPRIETLDVEAAGGVIWVTKLWNYPQYMFKVSYDVTDRQYRKYLENFYLAVGGQLNTFLFQDWTDPSPTLEVCSPPADGLTTEFKIPGDQYDSIAVFQNGVLTSLSGANPATGFFTFGSAPGAGVLIQATTTNQKYRVRFAGFSTKSSAVTRIGYIPFTSDQQEGEVYKVEVILLQQKVAG